MTDSFLIVHKLHLIALIEMVETQPYQKCKQKALIRVKSKLYTWYSFFPIEKAGITGNFTVPSTDKISRTK